MSEIRDRVKADLMAGIEGRQLYDAWAGKGFWTPVVKLHERDAGIVAEYVAALMAEAERERDGAQEHIARWLADNAPEPDGHAGTLTGDLAVDMAAYAGRLKERAEAAEARATAAEEALRDRDGLLLLVQKAISTHRDLHRMYGNTAACGGGIGGAAMTQHCGVTCGYFEKHEAENEAWHAVEAAYFRRQGGDPDWLAALRAEHAMPEGER